MEGRPSHARALAGVSPQRAREMSVEFISRNKHEFGVELRKFIISELGQSAFDSLPSQEER